MLAQSQEQILKYVLDRHWAFIVLHLRPLPFHLSFLVWGIPLLTRSCVIRIHSMYACLVKTEGSIGHICIAEVASSGSTATCTRFITGLKPVLNWANVCSPNILRTLRRTMIRFLIRFLVRRIWFGQSKLYFVLNWLVMRSKLRPELAADAQQTA